MSIPPAPATIVRTSRSCPGTSTTPIEPPPGSSSSAKPSSIEIPRRRSSASRSVSVPVSAATSAVLPWSMWPAVPSVSPRRPARQPSARCAAAAATPHPRRRAFAGRGAPARPRYARHRRARRRAAGRRGRRRRPGRGRSRRPGRAAPAVGSVPPPARRGRRARPSRRRRIAASHRVRARAPQLLLAGSAASPRRDRARRPRSRWSRSVASSAASCSLSSRSARASGWRRQRSTAAAGPARTPACGPPSSLSAGEADESAPAATDAAPSGSSPIGSSGARSRGRRSAAARARRRARRGSASGDGLGEADGPEVRLVDAQRAPPCPGRSRPRSRSSRVRFVVPTSTRRAPDCARISGIRNEPPISTSWPRPTIDLAAAGERGERQQHRGGVVVDRHRRLGSGQLAQQRPRGGRGGCRARRCRGRTRGSSTAGDERRGRRAPRGSGARPRFVWRITPVALISGRRRSAIERLERVAAPAASAASSTAVDASPARIASRERLDLVPGRRGRQMRGLAEPRGEALDRRQLPQSVAAGGRCRGSPGGVRLHSRRVSSGAWRIPKRRRGDLALPRCRLRLQDRPATGCADPRRAPGRSATRTCSSARDRRRRRGLPARPRAGARPHRRLLHPDRRRPASTSAGSRRPTRSPTSTRWAARRWWRSTSSRSRSTTSMATCSREILAGGAESAAAAGAVVGGGHSIDDPEPKYGLAVSGIVDPERDADQRRRPRPATCSSSPSRSASGWSTTAAKRGIAEPE